jgi:hypothetical protein
MLNLEYSYLTGSPINSHIIDGDIQTTCTRNLEIFEVIIRVSTVVRVDRVVWEEITWNFIHLLITFIQFDNFIHFKSLYQVMSRFIDTTDKDTHKSTMLIHHLFFQDIE